MTLHKQCSFQKVHLKKIAQNLYSKNGVKRKAPECGASKNITKKY